MTNLIAISIAAALALASPAFAAEEKRLAAVDALVARAVPEGGPGAVVAVSRNGELLHLAAYGLERAGREARLAPGSRFLAASTSKAFTAACVALLARDGKLSLDDDVRRHVPELPDYGGRTITIRHLLHHRSGLRDFYEILVLEGKSFDDSIEAKDVLALACRQKEIGFDPGSDASYSNTGYVLLAEIVKRASGGKSLRAFADERIFRPLGMARTLFRDDAAESIEGLAPGHDPAASGFTPRSAPPALAGPGGLVTTAEDLLRFEAAIRSGALAALGLDVPPVLGKAARRNPVLGHYAFGCLTGTRAGLRVAMSPGGSFGYQSQFLRVPDAGLAVVVLSNAASVRATELGIDVARAVLEAPAPAPPKGLGPPVPPPAGFHLFRETGTDDILVFSSRGDTHKIATLGWKATLAPAGGRAFAATDTLLPLAFRWAAAEDGSPASAHVEIEGESPRRYTAFPPFRGAPSDVLSLLGEWESDEVRAPLRLVEKRGAVAIDDAGFAMPVPPFNFVSADVLLSDAPARIDVVERGEDGKAAAIRVSTGRARNILYRRRG